MAVNKGFKTLAENNPDFSNQALENAIGVFKIGWVLKSSQLDTAIQNNTVLSGSQKNDIKDTINNVAHLNIGRYLNDMIRHTNTVLDGSIMPVAASETPTFTFLEALQSVQGLQITIPSLLGITSAEASRSVNDHFGTMNNIFSETEDSTAPVFNQLNEAITGINNANLATETALGTAIDNLKAHIATLTDDSTDIEHRTPSLTPLSNAVATAQTNFNNAMSAQPLLAYRTTLIDMREKINVQVALENSNIITLRTYLESLSLASRYAGLAADKKLRELMINLSQNASWRKYFEQYVFNTLNVNTLYATATDSDKSAVIDQALASLGLPDVFEYVDLNAVAQKSQRDSRIDTANYDRLTVEQQITRSCEQLKIETNNRSILNQSELLLKNMDLHDREQVANALDLHEASSTLN